MSLVTTMLSTVSGGAQTFTSITITSLTADRVVVTNGSKTLASSATTATELGYVAGVTSAIQTQLDTKLDEGNLAVSANTISSTNAGGDIILSPLTTGQVEIGANATRASRLRFREDTDNGVNYITIGAPATLAGNTDYDLPAAYPTVSGQVLASTTAGVTAWISPSDEIVVDQTTTPVSIVADIVYIANNVGLVTLNVPASAAVGDSFTVIGQGAGGWLVRMNTGQVANLNSSATSSAGSLASTNRYNCIKLMCTVANTTFTVISSSGTITVV